MLVPAPDFKSGGGCGDTSPAGSIPVRFRQALFQTLRRKGAGLDALQHIVNAVFRSEHTKGHIAVDCLDYRKGEDNELRETALLLAQRAATTGETQEIGPLNPYATGAPALRMGFILA